MTDFKARPREDILQGPHLNENFFLNAAFSWPAVTRLEMDRLFGTEDVVNMSMSIQDGSVSGHSQYKMLKISERGRESAWPKKTDIACWHCCHAFESPPVGIPIHSVHKTKKLMGNFCSFNCAYAWALDQANHHADYQAACRVKAFARDYFGIDPGKICRAPDRLALQTFGGNMSIDEFRSCSNQVQVIGDPFVSSHMLMCTQREEMAVPEKAVDASDKHDSLGDKRFTVTGLRRPAKPLPLDKVLCEQNVETKTGLFESYCQKNNVPQTGTTTVFSQGDKPPSASSQNSLQRFVRKSA